MLPPERTPRQRIIDLITRTRLSSHQLAQMLDIPERQVEEHLAGHLTALPEDDHRTRAVVEAMRAVEARHRESALRLGAAELPAPVKRAMRLASKVMTTVAYRV